jgi:hypothetical protein
MAGIALKVLGDWSEFCVFSRGLLITTVELLKNLSAFLSVQEGREVLRYEHVLGSVWIFPMTLKRFSWYRAIAA